jgi:enamine deaminase RidA (YjgF/YER057c/UK114 family)
MGTRVTLPIARYRDGHRRGSTSAFIDARLQSMDRMKVATGTEWEPVVGYSRAVRAGPHVYVSGTTATGPGGRVVGADAYEQTRQCLTNIVTALERAGARIEDVVRTRIYMVDIGDWREAGRAHGEVFGDIRPASSIVEISRLITPDMLVEIEAEAIVEE